MFLLVKYMMCRSVSYHGGMCMYCDWLLYVCSLVANKVSGAEGADVGSAQR